MNNINNNIIKNNNVNNSLNSTNNSTSSGPIPTRLPNSGSSSITQGRMSSLALTPGASTRSHILLFPPTANSQMSTPAPLPGRANFNPLSSNSRPLKPFHQQQQIPTTTIRNNILTNSTPITSLTNAPLEKTNSPKSTLINFQARDLKAQLLGSAEECFKKFKLYPQQRLRHSTGEVKVIGLDAKDESLVVQKVEKAKLYNTIQNPEQVKQDYSLLYTKASNLNLSEDKKRKPEFSFDDNHARAKRICAVFTKNYKEQKECDVYFEVKGVKFGASKFMLLLESDYFNTLLNEPFKKEKVIPIEKCDPADFKLLMDYIHTGEITLTEDNLVKMAHLGNQFGVEKLKNYCISAFNDSLNIENMIEHFNNFLHCDSIFFPLVENYLCKNPPLIKIEFLKRFSKESIFYLLQQEIFPLIIRLGNAIIWLKTQENILNLEEINHCFELILLQLKNSEDILICQNVFEVIFTKIELDIYRKSFEIFSDKLHFGFIYVYLLYKFKEFDKANELTEKLLELFPNSDLSLVCKANLLCNQHKFFKAIVHYKEVLKINPKSCHLHNYAISLGCVGNYKQAKVIWDILSLKQGTLRRSEDLYSYGIALYELGLFQQAKVQFLKASQFIPNDPKMLFGLSAIELMLQDSPENKSAYENAFQELQKQEKIGSFALRERARNFKKLGHLDEAAINFKKSMEQSPENLDTALMYIRVLKELKREEEANSLFKELLKNYPDEILDYLTF